MKISHERNDTMTTRTLPRTGEKRTSKLKYQILTGLMAAMIRTWNMARNLKITEYEKYTL